MCLSSQKSSDCLEYERYKSQGCEHMPTRTSNEGIAAIFEKMSRVLALKGKDRFRILAYQKAAQSIRDLEKDLSEVAKAGKLEDVPGIGEDLAGKIVEGLRTGHIGQCERECGKIPDSLLTLFEVRGLGPKTIALVHRRYKVSDVEGLKGLLDSGKLAGHTGFGKKRIAALAEAIEAWTASHKRMLLGLALPQAEKLLDQIRRLKLVSRAELAGSLRRGRETIGDVDLLVTSKDSAQALIEIGRLPAVTRVLAMGPTRASLLLDNLQVDVRAVAPESFGAALQYFTGSKQHNTHLRAIARRRGLKVNEYGVFRGSKNLGGAEEEDVYRLLKMPWIAPELREDRGEIEAAQLGTLPELVELKDLRGDLHAHTTYSDGRSTISEMITRADGLGYEYVALTDHSPSERVARGLDLHRLEKKIKEVSSICRSRGSASPRVLLGAEVDILADGALDYPDHVLARFDVVIAAIHGNFNQSRAEMTARILKAIESPYVTVIAHPTARLIDKRPAIGFDFDRVVLEAKEAGVALEIDGSPWRLDLRDTLARSAHEHGALLAITADAHSKAQLSFMRFGVMQARRGWVHLHRLSTPGHGKNSTRG
jgi:DNA polymerase (family X)